jgi:stage V sporulation protein R
MAVDLEALARWDAKVVELVDAYGLDCYPQEFEICDHEEMIGYMAYSGMPSRYPHWSYGKAYEKLKTLYGYGVQGLPYEMVINSDPCLAYLMGDNSLTLNVLTIAHVYGHNDFFRNNFTFASTRAEFTISSFKSRAERVRKYCEDPSIGVARVESILDAAHALSLQCRRDLAVRKLSPDEQVRRTFEASLPRRDPHENNHRKEEYVEPDLRKVPLDPEEDILLFVRDHNPFLDDWEKDLMTIVHEEACYFIPQIETKIMNEGWASYWHYQIMTHLDLPQEMRLEFMVNHNQVIQPHPGGLNPYHLGFMIWKNIYESYEGSEPPDHSRPSDGKDALFQARESERDRSFLRRFLTEELVRKLGLFEFAQKKSDYVVTEVADEEGWENIRNTLVASVGMAATPVIRIEDADHHGTRTLRMSHYYDGRELNLENAEKTLAYTHRLWGRPVVLDTIVAGKPARLVYDDDGFAMRKPES